MSEALYLRDPDGNGLELYWDRPRAEWPRSADGRSQMVTERLDLDAVARERHAAVVPRRTSAAIAVTPRWTKGTRTMLARSAGRAAPSAQSAARRCARGLRTGSGTRRLERASAAARHQRSLVRLAARPVGLDRPHRRDASSRKRRRRRPTRPRSSIRSSACSPLPKTGEASHAATSKRCSASRRSCLRTPTSDARSRRMRWSHAGSN